MNASSARGYEEKPSTGLAKAASHPPTPPAGFDVDPQLVIDYPGRRRENLGRK